MNIIDKLIEEILYENISPRLKKQKSPNKHRWKQLNKGDRIRISDLYDFIAENLTRNFTASTDTIPKSAAGSDIRFTFDYEIDGKVKTLSIEEAQSYLIQLLKTDKQFSDLVVTIIQPKINYTGIELSSKFPTLMISKPYASVELGTFMFFITHTKDNKNDEEATLTKIQLRPEYFNINGKTFTYDTLYDYIMSELKTRKLNSDIREFLIETMNMIDNIDNYKYSSDNIILKRTEKHKQLTPKSNKDVSTIYINFGEIIQPLVLAKKSGGEINFPASGGEQLVDFYIDDASYSTKYGKGAPPGMAEISREYLQQAIDTLGEDNLLVDLFKAIAKLKLQTGLVSLHLAEKYAPNIWSALIEFLEIDNMEIRNTKTNKMLNEKIVEYSDKNILKEKLTKFYEDAELNVRVKGIETYLGNDVFVNSKNAWGLISYPIRTKMVKSFNNDLGEVRENLKKLIEANSKIIQLKTYDTANELKFLIEHFNESIKVEFVPGGAYNSPNNQSIRFRVSKA